MVFAGTVLEGGDTLLRHIEPAFVNSNHIRMEETVVAVNQMRLAIWSIGVGT